VTGFAEKVGIALDYGVHVMVVDVIPPGEHDPQGMHGAIKQLLEDSEAAYDLPSDEPMTLASYTAGVPIDAHLEHAAVGTPLPEMPLFLTRDRYIYVPLEPTYQAAYKGLPAYWRGVLEGRSPQGS
jgi:hypothetical protein